MGETYNRFDGGGGVGWGGWGGGGGAYNRFYSFCKRGKKVGLGDGWLIAVLWFPRGNALHCKLFRKKRCHMSDGVIATKKTYEFRGSGRW